LLPFDASDSLDFDADVDQAAWSIGYFEWQTFLPRNRNVLHCLKFRAGPGIPPARPILGRAERDRRARPAPQARRDAATSALT
jgi:hypothetical protein